MNNGVCVRGSDSSFDFFGQLQDVVEIKYLGGGEKKNSKSFLRPLFPPPPPPSPTSCLHLYSRATLLPTEIQLASSPCCNPVLSPLQYSWQLFEEF
ncbi:TdcA1-ORF1-ORF2 protein [Corchorus capsularis]|uniref:TdcA1-ORF1-ORF2 protein n=1 Tax=Corchorus capsularis TaxID=210143 RepID=A0A1R3J528_COCAP|nr:TdcA1-ORF1-ORF2 protein [Corchorus capsularis]